MRENTAVYRVTLEDCPYLLTIGYEEFMEGLQGGICTPFGKSAGMYVTSLSLDPPADKKALSEFEEPFPSSPVSFRSSFGKRNEFTDFVYRELGEYFFFGRREFTFPILLRGTEFQRKVWEALSRIPYGETRSYKQIAEEVGSSKAYRAVGGANNKNHVAIAVPCHRVIGSDGGLVGYDLGTKLKETLLRIERSGMLNIGSTAEKGC